jgi:hypothetical protein
VRAPEDKVEAEQAAREEVEGAEVAEPVPVRAQVEVEVSAEGAGEEMVEERVLPECLAKAGVQAEEAR